MKIIHAADLHLDSPLRGLEAHESAPVTRLRSATRRACENLVQLAIDESVDLVAIAGDVYDGDWRDYSTGLFFRAQMARLHDRGIPVCLIAGNHDAASVISRRLSLPDKVHVFSTRAAETWEAAGQPLVVHGRGFPNRAVPENLARDYPPAVPGKFNLGLLHTSLTGRPGHDPYSPCSEFELREKGYGYWALGHIHMPEVVSRDPWIVFSGNCQGRHIREAGPRGCMLVEVNPALEVERVEPRALDVLRWEEITVDLAGAATETEALRRVRAALRQAVAGADGRLLAARIRLTGNTPLHGALHREGQRWQAELLACAQDQGPEALWIEQIQIATTPVYDPAQLAARDPLTRLVVEGLDQARNGLTALPEDIEDMLDVLPVEVRAEIEADWTGAGRQAVLNDVQAIVVEALATKGGQAA
jgi:DNA repair exonuclease SbcCD nuclease subunit